jgi:5-(carboxyamino)imidazole ribonucleotide synthase
MHFPTLGILGGGQLGKMMAAEAVRMGLGVRLLSPKDAGPMAFYADTMAGDWTDADVLRRFLDGVDAVTVESEWAPAERVAEVLAADERADDVAVWPSPLTLGLIRDKGVQKQHLVDAGLPVPDFACCPTLADALSAADAFGYPIMLKKYRGAYDGYGNATAHDEADLRAAWPDLAANEADADTAEGVTATGLMVERFMPFVRELAVQVARRPGGEQVRYPVCVTEQRDHRCHAVEVPAAVTEAVADEARRVAGAAIDAVAGVGLLAVELFEMEGGRVLINELAPRPHNTGHYSIEGCHTSQFENHVRAVLDLPLGSPNLRVPAAVMVNVVGQREGTPPRADGIVEALAVEGASVHVYGKPDVRPGRKLGHVTATGPDTATARARAEAAAAKIDL